jgi:ketosteroid isomerase-like protein
MLERNRTCWLAVALTLTVAAQATAGAGGQKKSGEPREARSVRAVLDQQVEAWNRRDLEGFMKGYWRSPDLTFFSGGTKTGGWKATLERYINSYQSEGREMGHLDFGDLQIELLGPRAAFVRGSWHLKMKSGDIGGLFTLIFRKLPEGWKIVHDHTGSAS